MIPGPPPPESRVVRYSPSMLAGASTSQSHLRNGQLTARIRCPEGREPGVPCSRAPRPAAEAWRSIQVVPVATAPEAAEAMRRAVHLLAEPFRRWATERQDAQRGPARCPPEVSQP